MEYIVYSGGSNGYDLYASSANFPEEHKPEIKKLYETYRIASNENCNATPRGIRMAPFFDGYLISVIYRGCTGNGETRQMFAGVNWFLSYSEQLDLFFVNSKRFIELLLFSNEILKENGYIFDEWIDPSPRKVSDCSEKAKRVLITSAYSSIIDNSDSIVQSFVGYNTITEAYDMLFWLLNSVPQVFWKCFKIYIGAASTSETSTSYLVFMNSETLMTIDKNENYINAMSAPKIALYGDCLSGEFRIPQEAIRYFALDNHKLAILKEIFRYSDDGYKFWGIVNALTDETAINNQKYIDVLGQELMITCVEKGIFSESAFISEISKNRSAYKKYTFILDFVDKKILQQEQEEIEYQEKLKKKKSAESRNKSESQDDNEPKNNKNDDDIQKTQNKANCFYYVGTLLKNKSFVYATISVLSLLLIITVDIIAVVLSTNLSFEGLKILVETKSILLNNYILTIIGLNIVNVPFGFLFVASAIEFFRIYFDKKRR